MQLSVGPKITAAFMNGFHRGSMVGRWNRGRGRRRGVLLPPDFADSTAETELVLEH